MSKSAPHTPKALCKNCRFAQTNEGQLECHEASPQRSMLTLPQRNALSGQTGIAIQVAGGWPPILESDWCGKYQQEGPKLVS